MSLKVVRETLDLKNHLVFTRQEATDFADDELRPIVLLSDPDEVYSSTYLSYGLFRHVSGQCVTLLVMRVM